MENIKSQNTRAKEVWNTTCGDRVIINIATVEAPPTPLSWRFFTIRRPALAVLPPLHGMKGLRKARAYQ
jgi:hypothetical protein